MKRLMTLAILLALSSPALADDNPNYQLHETTSASLTVSARSHLGGRPRKWCGWFMRTRHGGGPEYNLARNWAHRGSPTSPRRGAIVVWRGHVGEIVDYRGGSTAIVLSGNDGHAVRTRERRIDNAIAIRAI